MRKQSSIVATVEAQVGFHDVDVAAVVWHGHYLKYLENARWALMDSVGFGLHEMLTSGYGWPIVELRMKYVKAAKFGDRLAVRASLTEWQNRLVINYLITHVDSGERVARAQTVQAAVEIHSGVLQFATPSFLLERIAATLQRAGPEQAENGELPHRGKT